jgi:hypothetical protein
MKLLTYGNFWYPRSASCVSYEVEEEDDVVPLDLRTCVVTVGGVVTRHIVTRSRNKL